MTRILYLSPSPVPLQKNPQKNMFYYLSRYFSGDVVSPIWGAKNLKGIKTVEEVNLAMGNFQYHVTFRPKLPKFIKTCWDVLFYIFKGLYFHYFKGGYDVIITYGPFGTGLAGFLLKKFTNKKLIIEIPGNFKKAFLLEYKTPRTIDKLKAKVSCLLISFVIKRADHIKLLYPSQLNGHKNIKNIQMSIFHDFVPISSIQSSEESDKYILFLGYPWYLKGVDVLIRSFKLISQEFPEYKLKIVGYCPYKRYFEKLAEGNNKIELCKPVFHDEAMKLMCRCALFVLPSRTEAMGRVLLEAMASKKPIIASNVDGIPHYIKHGFNGLLFESENVDDLADKIRALLGNPDYALKLQKNGYKYVHEHLSEECYIESFKKMIDKVLECPKRR